MGGEESQMKRGGSRKRGDQDPLTPPPLDTPMDFHLISLRLLDLYYGSVWNKLSFNFTHVTCSIVMSKVYF